MRYLTVSEYCMDIAYTSLFNGLAILQDKKITYKISFAIFSCSENCDSFTVVLKTVYHLHACFKLISI